MKQKKTTMNNGGFQLDSGIKVALERRSVLSLTFIPKLED